MRVFRKFLKESIYLAIMLIITVQARGQDMQRSCEEQHVDIPWGIETEKILQIFDACYSGEQDSLINDLMMQMFGESTLGPESHLQVKSWHMYYDGAGPARYYVLPYFDVLDKSCMNLANCSRPIWLEPIYTEGPGPDKSSFKAMLHISKDVHQPGYWANLKPQGDETMPVVFWRENQILCSGYDELGRCLNPREVGRQVRVVSGTAAGCPVHLINQADGFVTKFRFDTGGTYSCLVRELKAAATIE